MTNHQEAAEHEEGSVHVHVTPLKTSLAIFGALVALTLATVGAYQVNLGSLNLVIAILIATMKASLVVLFFMHVKYETKFNAIVFLGSLVFVGIFLAYTVNDTNHRGEVDPYSGTKYDPATGNFAHGIPEAIQIDLKAKQK